MTFKEYGPGVSGYLDPEERAFLTGVFQSAKPVLDTELNLASDLEDQISQGVPLSGTPSGWLTRDAIDQPDNFPIFQAVGASNTLQVSGPLLANVNGWLVRVTNTGIAPGNQLDLGAGPAGAASKRVDFVLLEVWLRLLSAAPSTVGKSPAARIWRNGNVKVSPADDLVVNFPDDILDVNVGSETTKRVQVQYRLRVVQGVDLFSYPDGMSDPLIVARTVPPNAATPDGAVPPALYPYQNQDANGDTGLWRAGLGDATSASDLGTVDGFMYAIPFAAVFRRNTTAFAKNSNHNGGILSPGPSDRPDGLFHNVIVLDDVADLRRLVASESWSLPEVLQRNLRLMLDNQLRTEWEETPNGGGVWGHSNLWADEIGPVDTPGATLIGDFDAVLRRFSDRAVLEIATLRITGPFVDGQVITLNPTVLPVYPYAAFNWASFAPSEVRWLDVVSARFDGEGVAGATHVDAPIVTMTGFGTDPVGPVTLTLGTVSTIPITTEALYVDLLIAYPNFRGAQGSGLTRTPVANYPLDVTGASGAVQINNPVQLPAAAPILFSQLNVGSDFSHREVRLQYETLSQVVLVNAPAAVGVSTIDLPERALAITLIERSPFPGPFAPIVGGFTIDASGRVVTLTNPADFTTTVLDRWRVTLQAVRPLPQNGEQLTLYYPARAPQAVRSALLGVAKVFHPKLVGDTLLAITTGSGSQGEGYPFPYAYVQTGGVYPTSIGTFGGEHELDGPATLSVSDFNATTGWLKLHPYVGYEPTGPVTFTRAPTDADIEGRSFFTGVPPGDYIPNTFAQLLSDPSRHKNVLPLLLELPFASPPLGSQGALYFGILMRWAMDAQNSVVMNPDLTLNTTTLSIFRTKGLLTGRKALCPQVQTPPSSSTRVQVSLSLVRYRWAH